MSDVTVVIAAIVAGVVFGFAPAANADPYAGPHCDPSRRDYNSRRCTEEPVNNPACSPYGDHDQCVSDWFDYQHQQHDLYNPTPN